MDFYDGMVFNFYTGVFDYSNDTEKASLFGLEHQKTESEDGTTRSYHFAKPTL